jgi:FKBP-type peptidyl-prolyl cis-trans isomerases 1
MKKKSVYVLACFAIVGLFVSCQQKYPGFSKTSSGLYYHFYVQNKEKPLPDTSNFLMLRMAYFLNDSLIYDYSTGNQNPRIQLNTPRFKGDLCEGLAMMREGDSAAFIVRADSTFITLFGQQYPDSIVKPEDVLRFEIKMMKIQTKEAFEEEMNQLRAASLNKSHEAFQKYIVDNNIKVKPTESGLYYIPTKKGTGRRPVVGEKVDVHYVGRTLNGTEVDSSLDKPFSFVLGEGYVIPGWEEALLLMKKGEKATFVIPSELAYGENVVGKLPPFTNLVYDVELLNITTAKELAIQAERELAQLKEKSERDLIAFINTNAVSVEPLESGLYYIKHHNGVGECPSIGSEVKIKFSATYLDGTFLGASDDLGKSFYEFQVGLGQVLPGLDQGVAMMRKGEKATFIIPYTLAYGDDFYQNIPPYSNLIFDVELLDIVSKESVYSEKASASKQELEKYLEHNHITAQPTASGLIYIQNEKGQGELPRQGSRVKVHYSGKFLDGTVFDSSFDRGEPIVFELGKGSVIKGWEEGIAMMHKGEKGTLIIPFDLAYGETKRGSIPPYSSLIFDVELIDIE